MLDLTDLAREAERFAAQLRGARCCDALLPCYRCSLLKFNVLARRRVVEIPEPQPKGLATRTLTKVALVARARDLELHAS